MVVDKPAGPQSDGNEVVGEKELSTSRKVALVASMVACQLVQVRYSARIELTTAEDS